MGLGKIIFIGVLIHQENKFEKWGIFKGDEVFVVSVRVCKGFVR